MSKLQIFLITIAAFGLVPIACSSEPRQSVTDTPKPSADSATTARPVEATHAVVGEVVEAEPNGHHLIVQTKHHRRRVEITPQTEVRSLKHGMEEVGKGTVDLAKATAETAKNGTHVAVRYTEKEGKLIAHQVQHGAKEAVKTTEGVVAKVEDGGRKVIVKTKKGVEEAYDVGKECTITTGEKISEVGKLTANKLVEGTKATIHFTEEAGRKITHFVEQ